MNSPHKWPVTRKMFPFDDVIMIQVGARISAVMFGTQSRKVLLTSVHIHIYNIRAVTETRLGLFVTNTRHIHKIKKEPLFDNMF